MEGMETKFEIYSQISKILKKKKTNKYVDGYDFGRSWIMVVLKVSGQVFLEFYGAHAVDQLSFVT